MKRHKFIPLQSLLILICLFALVFTSLAKPIVTRPSLRLGFSIRMPKYSWVTFNCLIKNPDPKAHTVMMRITSEDGISQQNIFEDTVRIPAKTEIEYKTDLLIESAEKYNLEVFSDGKKVSSKRQDMILKLLPNKAEAVAILNDSLQTTLGAFNQLPEFKGKVFSSQFSSQQIPENWQKLKPFFALIVVEPDIATLNARQYKAILDYVSMGGTIVFAVPEALPSFVNTPLVDLLPVTPVKTRKLSQLNALRKLIPSFRKWQKPVNFMESIPVEGSQVLLKAGQNPVFAWKRYGLGASRYSAVPLCGSAYQNDENIWTELLNYSLKHQRFYPENEEFGATLDEMTGFPIPETSLIRNLFIGYFVILALLMIVGFLTRHSGAIWGVSAVYAVLATLFVLYLAQTQSKSKGKLLAAMEISAYNSGPYIPSEAYYALYSDTNTDVDINAKDCQSLLSAIPPNTNTLLPFAFKAMQAGKNQQNGFPLKQAYEIQRVDGVAKLADVNLRALSSKQFKGTTSSARHGDPIKKPILCYSGKGFTMKPWPIPAGYKPQYAFLQFPSGIVPLKLENNKAVLPVSGEQSIFQTDKIVRSLQQALLDGFKHTAPAVVLVDKLEQSAIDLSQEATIQGKRVTYFPVWEECLNPTIRIPAEQIVLTPGDSSSRLVMTGNKLKSSSMTSGASSYTFDFKLPPIFSQIKPGLIEVEFSYLNQGGNIEAQPYLLYQRHDGSVPGRIKGVQKKTGVFRFKGSDLKQVIDPLTGLGKVMVDAREKNRALNQAQKLRANKWDITKLTVTVKGSLPKSIIPLKY